MDMTQYFNPETNDIDHSIQELIDMGIVAMFSLGAEPIVSLTEYGRSLVVDMKAKPQYNDQPLNEEDEKNLQNFLNEVDKDLDKLRRS